jgi:hypothetical protein
MQSTLHLKYTVFETRIFIIFYVTGLHVSVLQAHYRCHCIRASLSRTHPENNSKFSGKQKRPFSALHGVSFLLDATTEKEGH